jgi:hypothetical protein
MHAELHIPDGLIPKHPTRHEEALFRRQTSFIPDRVLSDPNFQLLLKEVLRPTIDENWNTFIDVFISPFVVLLVLVKDHA